MTYHTAQGESVKEKHSKMDNDKMLLSQNDAVPNASKYVRQSGTVQDFGDLTLKLKDDVNIHGQRRCDRTCNKTQATQPNNKVMDLLKVQFILGNICNKFD